MELDVWKTRVAIQPAKALAGETSAVSKTVDGGNVVREFKSLPLRLVVREVVDLQDCCGVGAVGCVDSAQPLPDPLDAIFVQHFAAPLQHGHAQFPLVARSR